MLNPNCRRISSASTSTCRKSRGADANLSHVRSFPTIRTEGAILPADSAPADRRRRIETWRGSRRKLTTCRRTRGSTKSRTAPGTGSWRLDCFQDGGKAAGQRLGHYSLTRERWLLPSSGNWATAVAATKAIELEGKSYPVSHGWRQTPIHLVGCQRRSSTGAPPGVAGAARVRVPMALCRSCSTAPSAYCGASSATGFRLRILRDNIRLTRQAYVEFDLEAMMTARYTPTSPCSGCCVTQSRVEAETARDAGWSVVRSRPRARRARAGQLPAWRRGSDYRARARVPGPSRPTRCSATSSAPGRLLTQDYYRQLLRLVYRLLFLFVAEDRELLFRPPALIRLHATATCTIIPRHAYGVWPSARRDSPHGSLQGLRSCWPGSADGGCPGARPARARQLLF